MSIAGIDYDSFGVYIVTVRTGPPPLLASTIEVVDVIALGFRDRSREADASEAFPASRRVPRAIVRALKAPGRTLPEVAFVEKATGASRRSDFMLGRVQGLIVAGLEAAGVADVNELRAQEWKSELTGNGNAPKSHAHHALGVIFPEVERRERAFADENLRDALAIAYTGAKLSERASA